MTHLLPQGTLIRYRDLSPMRDMWNIGNNWIGGEEGMEWTSQPNFANHNAIKHSWDALEINKYRVINF